MDKSDFEHKGTGIPKAIRSCWQLGDLSYPDKLEITLVYDFRKYKAAISYDQQGRTRLFWQSDLHHLIQEEYAKDAALYLSDDNNYIEMRFERLEPNIFELDFISTLKLTEDNNTNEPESSYQPGHEGKAIYQYSKRYERDPSLRRRAIELHGLNCKACNFNFKYTYGQRGDGYIEIHHNKPLYLNDSEMSVAPETDLVPVCANCHRMIHRNRDDVMSIEQITELISSVVN